MIKNSKQLHSSPKKVKGNKKRDERKRGTDRSTINCTNLVKCLTWQRVTANRVFQQCPRRNYVVSNRSWKGTRRFPRRQRWKRLDAYVYVWCISFRIIGDWMQLVFTLQLHLIVTLFRPISNWARSTRARISYNRKTPWALESWTFSPLNGPVPARSSQSNPKCQE